MEKASGTLTISDKYDEEERHSGTVFRAPNLNQPLLNVSQNLDNYILKCLVPLNLLTITGDQKLFILCRQ